MGPWLSWESAAFASRRPRVRIPSGPPNKKDACRRLFYLVDLGVHNFFMFTIERVLTSDSACGIFLSEKLLLDFEEEVINPSGLRVWVLGERTAFLVLLSTKCSIS